MSAEGKSSPMHVVVLTDAPGTASTVDMETNKQILNSLNNNDQTMGQMAGLIAKLCKDGRPCGRKRSKRSADPASDTGESESEHEHYHRRSNSKRARENTPSDDDLSLDAQHDLDDEDLKLLTEQSSATSQARETPVPEGRSSKILLMVLRMTTLATGGKIMQQLADIAIKRWGKKLSSDKLKNLLDKCKRPENCEDIKDIKASGMLRILAKIANLWVTLHSDALTHGTTVLVTRNVVIKGLKEIFLWKGQQRSHRKKKPQTNEKK